MVINGSDKGQPWQAQGGFLGACSLPETSQSAALNDWELLEVPQGIRPHRLAGEAGPPPALPTLVKTLVLLVTGFWETNPFPLQLGPASRSCPQPSSTTPGQLFLLFPGRSQDSTTETTRRAVPGLSRCCQQPPARVAAQREPGAGVNSGHGNLIRS